jgi:Rieske Fe-S protein
MSEEHVECTGCALRQSDAVSRREFVSAATLSAVALALTACGGGGDDSTGPIDTGVGTVNITLADFPALATVGRPAVVRPSPRVAMVRTASGAFIAYSLSCTHQGSPVNIEADNSLRCPNHGARFTAEGVWTGGQATRNLVRLPVALNAGSTIATITLG